MRRAIVVLVVALGSVSVCAGGDESQAKVRVVLTIDNDDPAAGSYYLSIERTGEVERAGIARPGVVDVVNRVPAAKLMELREVIVRRQFFRLRKNYGCVQELGFRSIQVELGGRRHSVKFCPARRPDLPKRDIQALLTIWYATLNAVSRKGPVPVSELDKRFLSRTH